MLYSSEMSTRRVDPRVGSGQVGNTRNLFIVIYFFRLLENLSADSDPYFSCITCLQILTF